MVETVWAPAAWAGRRVLVALQHGVAASRDDKSTAHTCFVDDHVRSHARQLEQRLHRRVNVRRAFILHMQASGVVRRPRAALLCFTLTVAMPGAGRDCSSGLVESKPPNVLSRSRSPWNVHPVEWWLWKCFEFARPLLSVRAWALGVNLYCGANLQAPMRAPEHLDPQRHPAKLHTLLLHAGGALPSPATSHVVGLSTK